MKAHTNKSGIEKKTKYKKNFHLWKRNLNLFVRLFLIEFIHEFGNVRKYERVIFGLDFF